MIDKLGYRGNQAARQLRTGRSRLIGTRIEPASDGINGSVFDRFLHGLTEAATPAGYRLVLYPAAGDQAEITTFQELLASYTLDGFVLTSTHHGDTRPGWLAAHGVPFVTFGRPWSSFAAELPQLPLAAGGLPPSLTAGRSRSAPAGGPVRVPELHAWVDVDGAAGTAEATARLLAAGHRRIGFLGWPTGSGVGDDRRWGWASTLAAAGIDPTGMERATQDRVADGEQVTRELLARPDPPTALVCVSDSLALGALQVARAAPAGRGGDPPLAVIGFDDTPVAQAVGLTSVHQPLAEAAARCMQLLAGELDSAGGERLGQVLLRPRLSIRASG